MKILTKSEEKKLARKIASARRKINDSYASFEEKETIVTLIDTAMREAGLWESYCMERIG